MAKVTAQILGGQPRIVESVNTVQDVMTSLDLSGAYTIAINGVTANATDALPTSGQIFVSFAEKVKGA